MHSPTTVAEERRTPRTRRDLLAAAVLDEDVIKGSRAVWDTISAAEDAASRPSSALREALRAQATFREDIDPLTREALHGQMRSHAIEIYRAFQRGLSICPLTLEAMAQGASHPVRRVERSRMTAPVGRKLVALGFDVDDNLVSKITYAAAGDLATSLTLDA